MGHRGKRVTLQPDWSQELYPAAEAPSTSVDRQYAPAVAARSKSIDLLRGLVMVLMTLDHTRNFWSQADFSPTDLKRTTLAWFFTRWMTHFCAPVFVLLAGVSAYLTSARRDGAWPWARFLIIRGLWLMLLEITWVRMCWLGDLTYQSTVLQVIWAIGLAMVALGAALAFNAKVFQAGPLGKPGLVGLTGLLIIAGHNALDRYQGESLPRGLQALWTILHKVGSFDLLSGYRVTVYYPVLAWIGVLFVGFYLGYWWSQHQVQKSQTLVRVGVVCSLLFIIIRSTQIYGDPSPWIMGPTWARTLMSFLNTTKYPPSLAYLLMTLGPALIVLGWLEGRRDKTNMDGLSTLGKVPLFFYLAHLPLIHGVRKIYAFLIPLTPGITEKGSDPGYYGFGLLGVYAVTTLMLLILFPLCLWFARLKAAKPSSWLRYF